MTATTAGAEPTPTSLLAAHAHATRHTEPEPAVREKAVLCLLDAVGLGVAARDHPSVRAAAAVTTDLRPDQPGATVWATGRRAPLGEAVLANGIAAHAHFQDDTDMDAWAHPGSLVVPAALGLAELRGASLEVAVRGVVAGYTALNWLGAEGAVGRALVERGFRASPCLGSMAAAVAAATVLGLDATRARHAIGLAADVTGGVLEPVRSGAQDWRWQNGTASSRGATAALLAEAGMRGPAEPLAGPRGFLPAFCGIDVPRSWASAPSGAAIHRVWFKPYPILGDNTAAAVAAAALYHEVDPAEPVRRIDVHINAHFAAYPGTSSRGPFDTVEQAVASTAYAVAALLAYGDLRHGDFAAGITDRRILDLVDTVHVVPEPGYDYLDATVVVHTDTATHTRRTADGPRETFFRDRATARRAFEASQAGTDPRLAALPQQLFDWLDGADEPALFELLGRRPSGAGAS